mmetsp:Transcript_8394/g.14120  ORF Transcript_8394/g.14120 Transcript_8394/m.14120 type:complete len:98 (+) Transcript_8394:380-673(+)
MCQCYIAYQLRGQQRGSCAQSSYGEIVAQYFYESKAGFLLVTTNCYINRQHPMRTSSYSSRRDLKCRRSDLWEHILSLWCGLCPGLEYTDAASPSAL